MGRRRRYNPKKNFRENGGGSGPKKRKLNLGKVSSFEFQLKRALEGVEAGAIIFGNVCSKSTNIGIAETIEYLEGLEEAGNLTTDKAGELIDLLKRFSRYR